MFKQKKYFIIIFIIILSTSFSQEKIESKEVTVEKLDEEFDYNKLKVSELKSLAAAKKLEGYKSLKKGPLIELLKSSE